MGVVGVVIPVKTNFEGAIKTLASIKSEEHLIVPYIQKQWENDYPLSRAWNNGITKVYEDGQDYCLVVNDDIYFRPETLDAVIKVFEYTFDAAIMTPFNTRDMVSLDGFLDEEFNPWFLGRIQETPDMSAFLISRVAFEEVGLFDENFDPAYYEDNDYHYRIKLTKKWKAYKCSVPYYHIGSKTFFELQDQGVNMRVTQNRDYYLEKWGGLPGSEKYLIAFNK